VEHPAMPVRPIHHRRTAKPPRTDFSVFFSLFSHLTRPCGCLIDAHLRSFALILAGVV
jgi:hypothetical protein